MGKRLKDGRFSKFTTHCRNGHPRTPENTKVVARFKECKICIKAREARKDPGYMGLEEGWTWRERIEALRRVRDAAESPDALQLLEECFAAAVAD